MPLRIELIADTPDELQRMLRALSPLLQDELAPASAPVAIVNDDGKVAAFATTTEVKATRKGKTKADAPAEPTPAGSEDATPDEGLDAPASDAPVSSNATDTKELLKTAIDNARIVFARGAKGSNRIAELRAKYNPDANNKKFKFEDVPADRIEEFHADVMASLEEIPA